MRTLPYSVEDIVTILQIRAETESLTIEDDALQQLGEIGSAASLRYSVQLLTPAAILAKTCGREAITKDDISEIDGIFFDARASAKHLAEHADKYIS